MPAASQLFERQLSLERRRAAWRAPEPVVLAGGCVGLHLKHVQQADTGANLDFLIGCRGHLVGRESH